LTHKIRSRIARYIERHGFIERDAENSFLAELNGSESRDDQSYSVNYRISVEWRVDQGISASASRK
jgi:hypothetical protein